MEKSNMNQNTATLASPCVLIVDDDETLLRIYKTKLTQVGFRMLTAENGAEALTVAAKERPDLILMDMKMPVMDGLTAVNKLKEDPATRDLKVVFLTAFSDSVTADINGNIKVKNVTLGAIKKGIGLDDLVAEVRRYLTK